MSRGREEIWTLFCLGTNELPGEKVCSGGTEGRRKLYIYLFKAGNENTETMCEICSVLKMKTPERRY